MEFAFLWDAAEHRRLYVDLWADVRRRSRRSFLIMPVVAGSVAAVTFRVSGGRGTVVMLAAALLATVVGLLIVHLINGVLVPRLAARRYARHHARCHAEGEMRVIDADGVEARCGVSQTRIRWSGIVRATETRDFFLFFATQTSAFALPKRAVDDADRLRAVRAQIRAAIGPRAELSSD